MKNLFSFLMLIFLTSQFNVNAAAPTQNDLLLSPDQDEIEVIYFHYSRRCATCEAVENQTQIALKEYFSDRVEAGTITFFTVNIEEESNETLIDTYEISGQSLLVISGDEKVDLTNDAFMYVRSKPEKYRKLVKKTIEGLIK
jgi:hypothetical protein